MSSDRFLEYTNKVVAEKFRPVNDDVLLRLKAMPVLFAYERFVKEPARVGRITEIQRLTRDLRVTLALDPSVPPIPPATFEQLHADLDIEPKFEVSRTHWAIKEVDLVGVLRQAGIIVGVPLVSQARPPKVFISYSWDSPEHRQWVAQLGGFLRQNGIDVTLDQWNVRYGEDLAAFMETAVREADRVLVICTDNYADKASKRTGGVGYELLIVTGELMQNVGTTKFIPVVRQSAMPPRLPAEFRTRKYFDLSDGHDYEDRMRELVRELHDARIPIPPMGANPFT